MEQLERVEPCEILIDLQHYHQKYSWDCGISCILMILCENKRRNLLENFREICHEEGFNKSTWTIDLSYLLKRYDINHTYYTTTLGIHPDHRENNFYINVLTTDEERINNRFESARRHGIKVIRKSVDKNFILNHLKHGPIILLTNARLLCCDICTNSKLRKQLQKCMTWPGSYQGHYIVVCGYDTKLQKVYYRNPACKNKICRMSINCLDEARKSYGTDEDVIVIFKS